MRLSIPQIGRMGMLAILLATGSTRSARSDEARDVLDRWMQLYDTSAMSVEMHLADRPDVPLSLNPTPLLKYTNPVRMRATHGAVYVWTIEKRPAVIAAFWSASPEPGVRRLNFEWHSLQQAALVAEYDGERIWATQESGLEWQVLPDASSPAVSRQHRVVQMRRLASSFTAEIPEGESELRLLAQPVFRYREAESDVTDGAVFAYVMGTDPELFLLLEARAAANGTAQWHVGFVRFTNAPLTVRREGREWWSCGRAPARIGAPERNRRYFVHLEVERLPEELDAASGEKP